MLVSINKSKNVAYNKVVEKMTVSERKERSAYISYLYNALLGQITASGGTGELVFGEERAALRISAAKNIAELRARVSERIAEVVCIGYKYTFLAAHLNVSLSKREKKLLCAALIAADFEGDRAFVRRKLERTAEYSIDGFYDFRLGALREKWARIVDYVPESFSSHDLGKFCEFLVGESRNKIYVKGNTVFAENFTPLRRSRLTGEEDVETEIMLSDAGFVYCLGDVEEPLGDFLQKFYAERAIFS